MGERQASGATADVRILTLSPFFLNPADQFGQIDVLISGAAGNFPALLNGLSPNGFKSEMEIDLLGTFHVMRAGYAHLRQPGARVINISAPQAWLPMIGQVHARPRRAWIWTSQISASLRELGPKGILVNSISPGPIDGTEGMARLAVARAERKNPSICPTKTPGRDPRHR